MSLQDKLKSAADADEVEDIAREAGFSISTDDLKKAQSEVSEEELEGAAGGVKEDTHCWAWKSACLCNTQETGAFYCS